MQSRSRFMTTAVALTSLALCGPARAQTLSGQPTAAEAPFVAQVSADLTKRFPTPADAVRAGYLRFTDEDDTGAISYANRQWDSRDPQHPSQLWYDVHGRLLGADFSVPKSESPSGPPHRFGVEPARWATRNAHVHYGIDAGGEKIMYGATGAKAMASAGASVEHPTAEALVNAGIAKSVADVAFVFTFPASWDLTVWVVPNPSGAFADANPNVKPSRNAAPAM